MNQSPTISPSPPMQKSMDYAALRQQGLDYIQQLAGKLWTDYNLHDPGVTILEAICFAITDLGYRANYEIEDILTEKPDTATPLKQFFPPAEILTCNPLTATDIRKLIVGITGVRNAWLEKNTKGEKEVFVQCQKDGQLTYVDTGHQLQYLSLIHI